MSKLITPNPSDKPATPLSRKNRWSTLVKAAVVFGLLYFLARKGLISIESTGRALRETRYMVPALICLTIATFLGLFRWQILLKAQDIHLPLLRTLELGFVGLFFNIALPGAVSGDIVKALYIGKEIRGKRALAFGSILFDRVAGSSALLLVSVFALLLSLHTSWSAGLLHAIRLAVLFTGAVIVLFYIYLFWVRSSYDPLLITLKKLEKRFHFIGSVTRIYEGIKSFENHKGAVGAVLLLSLVIHTLVTFSILELSRALGQFEVPPLAVFIVAPLALLVTAIPIFPAGVGTGHAAFYALFALLGSQKGAEVFNLYVLYQLFVGALGGLVYLRYRSEFTPPTSDSVTEPYPESGLSS